MLALDDPRWVELEHLSRPAGPFGKAAVVPLINMVDEPEQEALARQVSKWALALTRRFDRVVLASMLRYAPVVAVITR